MSFWDRLVEGLRDIGTAIGDWTPRILGALIVLIVGRWIAGWLRKITKRLLQTRPAEQTLEKSGVSGALQAGGYNAVDLLAGVVYAIAILITLLFAAEVLDVATVTDLLRRLIAFLPKVVVAIIVVVVAAAVANFLADIVRPWAQDHEVPWLEQAARWIVLAFGLVTALDVLEIGFATNFVFMVVFGALGAAFAISFGVGGIDTARRWWSKYLAPRNDG